MQELPQVPPRPLTEFEEAFLLEYPDDAAKGLITRKQIHKIVAEWDTPYPTKIVNPKNKLARGVFRFNAGFDINHEESFNVEHPSEPIRVLKESDEDVDTRIRQTYENMRLLTTAVADNNIRSLIISGSAGVGKSWEVIHTLEAHGVTDYTIVTGYLKCTGLFKLLYENRFENQVLILDDSDKILTEMDSLNLLKNALELKKTRKISWLSEKSFFTEDGEQIPRTFDYEGSMIFLTNIDFQASIEKDNTLSPHLQALDSRSIYLDLKIKTRRDILMRIKQVMSESDILTSKGLYKRDQDILLQYLTDNLDKLKDLSLRTIEKLAALYISNHDKWQDLASAVMLK